MGIDPLLWEEFRPRIENLYYFQGYKLNDVISTLAEEGFIASRASYFRQLEIWNNQRQPDQRFVKRIQFYTDQRLVELVRYMWHRNYTSASMLSYLQVEYGYSTLTANALKDLRLHHGLFLRYPRRIEDERRNTLLEARDFILAELESGLTTRWGNVYSHTWTRSHIPRFISREDTRMLIRLLDSAGVEYRDHREQHVRRRMTVKGPNRNWSVDGHDKLAQYGFQIYGIIDAYSRFIIGVHVGISNRTQVAVLKFYLQCVRRRGCFPKKVRSDKGAETVLMAAAQAGLRRTQKPGLPFSKAYTWGPSTKNQRIESWWNLLATALTLTWVHLFQDLANNGLYDKDSVFDVIAIRYMYMPKIRAQVEDFVEMHNIHPIRAQRSRADYIRTGRPEELYLFHRGRRDYRCEIQNDDTEGLLDSLENSIRWYDLDAYQTEEVRKLCKELLQAGGVTWNFARFQSGIDSDHVKAYNFLRNALQMWSELHQRELSTFEPPRGGIYWIRAMEELEQEAIQREAQVPRNRLPTDIPEEELVSEEELVTDEEREEDEESIYIEDNRTPIFL